MLKDINFDFNPNNKLLSFCFVVVDNGELLNSKQNIVGDVLRIKIRGRHFCYGKILKKEFIPLETIVFRGLNFLDMKMSEKDYLNYWLAKTKDNTKEIDLNVYYFEKITQLDLFDEHNENYI